MKRFAKAALPFLSAYGLSPRKTFKAVPGTTAFISDLVRFRRKLGANSVEWPFGRFLPCLEDRHGQSGIATGHYFHQDLLVARRIFSSNPIRHIDIGSRVDGFIAHVAAFRPIEVGDIRPLSTAIPNVSFFRIDLMAELPTDQHRICDSLSCLHALEHLGLGRYGDRIDPYGYRNGFANLAKMLASPGTLYFSVPIGPQRIEFNAHRVFSIAHLLAMFDSAALTIREFSYVDDHGDLHESAHLTPELISSNCGTNYGCGIFQLTRH